MASLKKKWDPFGRPKGYLLEPRVLRTIAKEAAQIQATVDQKNTHIIKRLAETYPGHITTKQSWIFNNAGGAMGQMTLLHASLREYLILFGTAVGTEGHSGRYSSDVFDFVYDGEMWCTMEGLMVRLEFKNGKGAMLPWGRTKQYKIPDHGWMLEYGRGHESIITMFPFGLADSLMSTLDYKVVGRTLYHYASLVTKELLKGKDLDVLLKWILKGLIFIGIPILLLIFLL